MTEQTCRWIDCEDLTNPKSARGLCSRHYAFARQYGHLDVFPRSREVPTDSPFPMSPVALSRFEAKYTVAELGCWQWNATTTRGGYGMFSLAGRLMQAHRVSYEHHVGPIPEGLVIDHLCRNRGCVNPGHLEPVVTAENNRRGINPTAINARKTLCVRGHALEGDNLIIERGGRQCRACRKRLVECEHCDARMQTGSRAKHMREKHGGR